MKRAGLVTATLGAAILAGCSTTDRRPSSTSVPVPSPPKDVAAIPDAVPRFEPRSKRGNPAFYEVMGKRYTVLASAEGYLERGVASWYGPNFHGALTSMGERYDMYGMTGAHKTLPLPAYARVTNLSNGRSVVVRINDRGPFVANRIIDLSYTAAAKLDMLRAGTTLVEVRTLVPGESDEGLTRASQSPPPELYIQAGAFAEENNALRLVERLRAAGIGNAFVMAPAQRGTRLFRVRVGPITSTAEFDRIAADLATQGVPDAHLAVD